MSNLIIGALLAVFGGYIGDEIRSWRQRCNERKAIKISLCDELSIIESTINNMHQVWENAKVFPQNFVADLLSNTIAYDGLRTRLFLIKDATLRKKIVAFYKKLRDTVKKTEGKIGTLAQTPEAAAEQNAFDTSFQTLGTEAKDIKEALEK